MMIMMMMMMEKLKVFDKKKILQKNVKKMTSPFPKVLWMLTPPPPLNSAPTSSCQSLREDIKRKKMVLPATINSHYICYFDAIYKQNSSSYSKMNGNKNKKNVAGWGWGFFALNFVHYFEGKYVYCLKITKLKLVLLRNILEVWLCDLMLTCSV